MHTDTLPANHRLHLFSELANRSPGAPLIAEDAILAAEQAARTVATAQEATIACETHMALFRRHAPNARLGIACGMLLEKQRLPTGLLSVWADLLGIFPGEPAIVRMLMRWYRRSRMIEEGLQRLHQIVPVVDLDPAAAELRLAGYVELNAFAEIDRLMASLPPSFSSDISLGIKHLQSLLQQGRMIEAAQLGDSLSSANRLGPAARALVAQAKSLAQSLKSADLTDVSDVVGDVVARFQTRVPRPFDRGGIGPVVFFTGQLGAGGAERQMSRIAAAFQQDWNLGHRQIGSHQMQAPPRVCLRHATAASGADFFLPVLHRAGVDTTILADLPLPDDRKVDGLLSDASAILPLLPEDLRHNTLKLVSYFRECRADVAYLWQDGGVLTAALAALLAKVPRIVTSFRGQPPNLRPELMRPQMPALFRALAKVPGVTFTANSRATAVAYEDWLGLRRGFIEVIPNAVPVPTPEGAPEDHRIWEDILAASPDCSQTVLGIFRFDHNKRPEDWVRLAADHASARPGNRFVILGVGVDLAKCRLLVEDLGMSRRIFLPGATHHVGFYLHRSDLVMHLARYEGLPNALIEAQLAGKPVLATPAGGTAEIVRHGETGILLSDNMALDRAEVFRSLDHLLQDPVRLADMGLAAQRHSIDRFRMDRILEQTLSIFDREDRKEMSICGQS